MKKNLILVIMKTLLLRKRVKVLEEITKEYILVSQTFLNINYKMTKIIIFLMFGLHVSALYPQEKGFVVDTLICNGDFLYKKRFIPNEFYIEYQKQTGYKFKIVNPSRNIRKSDIVYFNIKPLRRLVFLLKKDNKYLLVAERGGNASGISCIYFSYKGGTVLDMNFIIIPIKEYNEESFCDIIKSKTYTINNNSLP